MAYSTLDTPLGQLAYAHTAHPDNPAAVLFLGGFMSDMQGSKASYLDQVCPQMGLDFIRFDYLGHGVSGGEFKAHAVSDWVENTCAIIDSLSEKPLILVGSSMGGWMMLRAYQERAHRIRGMIGIAPAPDFTENLLLPTLSTDERKDLDQKGFLARDSGYDSPHIFTKRLFEEGKKEAVLEGALALKCPLTILQGQQDTAVPWDYALKILSCIEGTRRNLVLVPDADHGFSRPEDLLRLRTEIKLMLD